MNLICIKQGNIVNTVCDFYQDASGEIYMTGEQIGECLGYANPIRSISNLYKKFENRLAKNSTVTRLMTVDNKRRSVRLYNEQGIYFIAMRSDTERALDFQEAVAIIIKDLRKQYITREASRITRRGLTDIIRDEIPDSPHKRYMYKNLTDLIYKTVLGCTAKEFRELHGLAKDANVRNFLTPRELEAVERLECLVKDLIRIGWNYGEIKSFISNRPTTELKAPYMLPA